MRRGCIFLSVITLLFLLSACGTAPAPDMQAPSGTPEASLEENLDDAQNQSGDSFRQVLQSSSPESSQIISPENNPIKTGPPDGDEHSHVLSSENNVLEHDPAGYCGNTMTTVIFHPTSGEEWECSFWGDDSVSITDLLRFLDYNEGICRCMPEYTVTTEFGQDYGINLTEGYVRCGESQVSLTAEQLETIRNILERASAAAVNS